MPARENAMQSVDDLLRKNLEAFGERDAMKRRTATGRYGSLTAYSSILTVCTLDRQPSTMLSSTSC
jgi:hypothetical protein